jgi:glycosyltransferase involved in cell wall biosynthesis
MEKELQTRRKVLVSAYACEPGLGSEPGIGWNWVCQIARFSDTWVITRSNNRAAIERRLASDPLPDTRFVYYDLPRWASFWKKGQRGFHLYYQLWQAGALGVAKRLHREIGFDLAHHVTLGAFWKPSFLALLGVPFIWGPVGGGESTPRTMRSGFHGAARFQEWLREAAQTLGSLDPFVRMTARRAQLVLATTGESAERVRRLGSRNITVLSHVGLPAGEIRRLSHVPVREGRPFRALTIGRLLHWKGHEMAVRAFAQLRREVPDAEYWIVGSGPEKRRLTALVSDLGLADCVTFRGELPRGETLDCLASCDALLHPSLHDSGAWVVAEAMAAARPVVCLDCGGPALLVTGDTGFKVPPDSPAQAIRDLAAALGWLALDAKRRCRMGLAARLRVERYMNWDRKGECLQEYTLAGK